MVNVDSMVDYLSELHLKLLEQHAPTRLVPVCVSKHWFNSDVSGAICAKDSAYIAWRRSRSAGDRNRYRFLRNSATRVLCDAKHRYFSARLSVGGN